MRVHDLEKGPFSLYSYGSPYYAFIFPENEVVIYDPREKKPLYIKKFDQYEFTSMIMIGTAVYIGLSNGNCLALTLSTKYRRSGLHEYQYDEIHPVSLWGDGELPEVNMRYNSMTLLGGDSDSIFFRESHQLSNIVYIACRGGYCRDQHLFQCSFRKSHIELYKFDARRKRVLLLVKKSRFYLYVLKVVNLDIEWQVELDKHDLGLDSDVTWTPVAVSTNGEVAFNHNGQLRILNLDKEKGITKLKRMGDWRSNRLGGQGCFLGEYDEYFAYCGGLLSEIAIAKRGPDGWIGSELLSAETADIFSTEPTDRGYSNFQDLGTDGKNLIVRVGSDYASDDLEGTRAPNVLWVFSLRRKRILKF
jgi:hypothetical protein